MPRDSRRRSGASGALRKWSLRFGLVGAGFAVAVVSAEVGLRLFAPQPLATAYRSPSGLALHIPNARIRYVRAEFDHVVEFNSLGLRGREVTAPKEPGTLRILLLGDSFTEGKQVVLEDTFCHRLEAALRERYQQRRFEVVNAGVTGYGTGEQLKYFQIYGRELEPDVVVAAFYVGNDLMDNGRMRSFRWRDGSLEAVPVRELSRVEVFVGRAKEQCASRSHVCQFLRDRFLHARRRGDMDMEEMRIPHERALLSDSPSEKIELPWMITEALLDRLRDEVERAGARFLLAALPARSQVEREAWIELEQTAHGSLERDAPQARLAAYARDLGIDYVDVLPALREASRREPTYYRIDSHFNAHGHAVTAGEILGALERYGVLSAREVAE